VAGTGNIRPNRLATRRSPAKVSRPPRSARVPLRALALVNAMAPVPGESPGEWWGNVGSSQARIAAEQKGYDSEFDLAVYFLHDVAPEIAAAGEPSAGHRARRAARRASDRVVAARP
jgi:hypothetical protein